MRMKFWATVVAFVVSLVVGPLSLYGQAHCKERRSVDAVDKATIQALSDAIQKLKSQKPDRYEFWKNVHGRFPEGPCDHSDDQLLPWHRAMLMYFEQELRSVSGDACLALVYWDWTTNATGKQGYPTAFEDAFPNMTRNDNSSMSQPAIAPGDITTLLAMSWPDFSAGIQSPHAYIHVDYVGGDMLPPRTAANDFIFYGHHANLDRIFAQWQKAHPKDGPPNESFTTSGFPKPTSTNDVLDITKLGYSYDIMAAPFAAAAQASSAPYPPSALSLAGGIVTTFPVSFKELRSDTRLVLENVPISSEFSEQGIVYLHPESVPYRSNPQFVRDYYAGYFFIWKRNDGDHPTHPAATNVVVDVGRRFSHLSAGDAPKGKWVVTVVTSRVREKGSGVASASAESALNTQLKFHSAAIKSKSGRTLLKATGGAK